jgi:hypothetical protein
MNMELGLLRWSRRLLRAIRPEKACAKPGQAELSQVLSTIHMHQN